MHFLIIYYALCIVLLVPLCFLKIYHLVIGAGRNSFSTIRTNMGRRRVATNQDANILSMLDPTPIEIIQTKGTCMHD